MRKVYVIGNLCDMQKFFVSDSFESAEQCQAKIMADENLTSDEVYINEATVYEPTKGGE